MYLTKKRRLYTTTFLLTCSLLAYGQAENMDTIADWHHLSAYLVAGLLIGLFIMIFSNRLYYYREREVTKESDLLNTQLALVLDSNKTQVWTYDPAKKIYTTFSNQDGTKTDYTIIDFAQFFNHNDFNALRKNLMAIGNGEKESETMLIRGKRPNEEDQQQRIYEVNLSVLPHNHKGVHHVLLGIQQDITEERQRREQSRKLSLRYHTVFNSSLVDMVFYDENGILTDINDKACETFGVADRKALLERKVHFKDIPTYANLDINHLDNIEMSSLTDIDKTKQNNELIPEVTTSGKLYYETNVAAVRDEQGKLRGVIAAGRNITEMVESHHHQQWVSKQLEQSTKDIQAYIQNLNYALKVSNVRLFNYYPSLHELEIYSDLNNAQYHLSQIRCISLVADPERRRARGVLQRMDRLHPGSFAETLCTKLRDENGRNIYLTFIVIPVTDKDGNITHYFGMCRNDTEMVNTEQKLRIETEKAQETEQLKNTFLLNMSYEIRTPLNAVLGFAELFNGPHDEQDEPVFAEEIRRNTGELLELINDILFISRLDAKMVEFNKKECDFATLFDGYCYMGWSMLNPGVKVAVENPYNRLMVEIDDQNLGMVIQKLCAGAARSTTEGTIRAKYEYRHGELSISIEDTSKGLSKDTLAHIFERFARDENNEHTGTGLDVPIIRELTEQMGGSFEIQSEEGKGTTVYVIVPCKMNSMEKKAEIV